MAVKVLLADDSDIMREAIVRLLKDEPRIKVVAEGVSFAEIMQMRADFKPTVLLMDLHLPEKRDFAPAFVRSQLSSIQLITISVANDDEARALAVSYGALVLLDKKRLYGELIPTIMKFALSHSSKVISDKVFVLSQAPKSKAA